MKLLQERTAKYRKPQEAMKLGVYPFYQPLESGQGNEVIIRGKRILMFGSNSYLGLTNHPELKLAAIEATYKYGTGVSGSRLMNGNLDLHEQMEEELAKYVNKPSSVVFSTGFQVNLGAISCLLKRNDYLIIDETNHASIIEGCRLSYAKALKYRHNDMESLEKVLKSTQGNSARLIVTDGIFSMEGDIAKLDQICQLSEKYSASVMVDDAHSIGVIGEMGSGTASHFGVTKKTDLIMGTFSKSLASLGGFIAGDFDTINFIKHNARSLIFSASIPPASSASVLKALEIIKREPERRAQLWENTRYAKQCLLEENFNIGNSTTPIIPLLIGDDIRTYQYTSMLIDSGIYVNPVVHPAVQKGKSMLRFSLMSTHTKEQIEFAIEALIKCRTIIDQEALLNAV